MKKVIFIGNWGESSSDMLKRYSNQTPNNRGRWKDIQGVDELSKADYFIIMDGASDNIIDKLDWSRTIYFQREPPYIKKPFLDHDFPDDILYNGSYEHCHNVPTWWINISFDELAKLPYPKKTKKISTITSGKASGIAYSNRVNFLKDFCKQYNDIDIYGRGENTVGDCWRGPLNYNGSCKFKGHIDYEYSFALENTLARNSWTEKPCDSILSWAFPIYSGANNFNEYFPEESFYKLDVVNYDVNNIIEFISEPPSQIQVEALEEARNLLLYKWNIWPTIKHILDKVV